MPIPTCPRWRQGGQAPREDAACRAFLRSQPEVRSLSDALFLSCEPLSLIFISPEMAGSLTTVPNLLSMRMFNLLTSVINENSVQRFFQNQPAVKIAECYKSSTCLCHQRCELPFIYAHLT